MKRRALGSKTMAWALAATMAAGLTMGGCGGGTQQKKEEVEPVGTLKRTFTLVDEQGRKSGTLVLNPLGGAELLDTDGQVIGTFQSAEKVSPMAEPKPAAEAKEEETQKKE